MRLASVEVIEEVDQVMRHRWYWCTRCGNLNQPWAQPDEDDMSWGCTCSGTEARPFPPHLAPIADAAYLLGHRTAVWALERELFEQWKASLRWFHG